MRQCTTKKVTSTHEVKNPWWSNECYLKRRAMTDELHLLRAGKGDTNKYRALKKEYKNTCKKSKETYKEKCRSELETVKSIQDGWKFISKYRKMRRPAPLTYPPDLVLFEHFKNLLQGPKIDDEPTRLAVEGERSFLNQLNGGCQVPMGVYGTVEKGQLILKALIASLDGKTVYEGELSGPAKKGVMLGKNLAKALYEEGGKHIVEALVKEGIIK